MKKKYQSVLVTILSGTATGTLDHKIVLEAPFNIASGVVVYEGVPNPATLQIGLADDDKTYHNLTPKADWTCGDTVPLNERYKNIDVPVTQNPLYVRTKHIQQEGDIEFTVVFRLEKTSNEA